MNAEELFIDQHVYLIFEKREELNDIINHHFSRSNKVIAEALRFRSIELRTYIVIFLRVTIILGFMSIITSFQQCFH